MKPTYVCICLCLLPLFISCGMTVQSIGTSLPQDQTLENAENTIQNQDILEVDTIAFEVNDLLAIREKLGEKIAAYRRIPNPNYSVYSAKVYSDKGRELYTLVPNVDQSGIQIHIRDRQGQRGKVEISAKPEMGFGQITIRYTNSVDFFGEPFGFDFYSKSIMTAGFSPDVKSRSQYVLNYRDRPVLAFVSSYDQSHPDGNKINIIADHEFVKTHEQELAAWCVLFVLLQDVNKQMASDSYRQNPGHGFGTDDAIHSPTGPLPTPNNTWNTPPPPTQWNNNGTIDNNHNPFDSF
jgi:hypothetical protein